MDRAPARTAPPTTALAGAVAPPVVALVGRPNVGKSTLFNALTRSRDALVADQPGVTRDRHYGICALGEGRFVLVDTGGLNEARDGLDALTERQSRTAIAEADLVVLVVDARDGLLPIDETIVRELRGQGKPFLVAVNKTDGLDAAAALAEFAPLGARLGPALAAAHRRGVPALVELIHRLLAELGRPALPSPCEPDAARKGGSGLEQEPETAKPEQHHGPVRVCIVGRPNVGKSTLVNRLLGEERVIASEVPGTTRDPIAVELERDGRQYLLIDTAGVRRRARVEEGIEKFSVIKTLQSIEAAEVVILMLDGTQGVTDQDATLLGHVLDAGRALVIAINKWDGLGETEREHCRATLGRKLAYVRFARRVTISALHGSGLRELMRAVDEAEHSASRRLSAHQLTTALAEAVAAYQPPLVRGRSAKLRYAHPGGTHPPRIVVHGNRVDTLPPSYLRYLENHFRERFGLVGTPLRFEFRSGENPYKDRPQRLTERQLRKRRRLLQHVKRR